MTILPVRFVTASTVRSCAVRMACLVLQIDRTAEYATRLEAIDAQGRQESQRAPLSIGCPAERLGQLIEGSGAGCFLSAQG